MTDKDELFKYLFDFSSWISKSLRNKKIYAYSVTVTIRNDEFKTYNHGHKYLNGVNSVSDIYDIATRLFNEVWNKEPVRLIGLRVTDFSESNNYQLSLFEEKVDDVKMNEVVDKINNKFGKNVIKKGIK